MLPDLPQAERCSVLVNEAAHELLHRGDRRTDATLSVRQTKASPSWSVPLSEWRRMRRVAGALRMSRNRPCGRQALVTAPQGNGILS